MDRSADWGCTWAHAAYRMYCSPQAYLCTYTRITSTLFRSTLCPLRSRRAVFWPLFLPHAGAYRSRRSIPTTRSFIFFAFLSSRVRAHSSQADHNAGCFCRGVWQLTRTGVRRGCLSNGQRPAVVEQRPTANATRVYWFTPTQTLAAAAAAATCFMFLPCSPFAANTEPVTPDAKLERRH